MADTAPTSPETAAGRAPLDDVMIAMDVVDTLRHDKLVVERELDSDARRDQLIERLREIYRSQGIDVPDSILAEGVKALEEDRFVYKPPAESVATRLARLYVTRSNWGSYALGALAAVAVLWIGWFMLVDWPRQSALREERTLLTEVIPARLEALEKQIAVEVQQSGQTAIMSGVSGTVRRGLAAGRAGDIEAARSARAELESKLARLRQDYTIRVVTGRGELSGLWRVPRVNPDARNYYLVVQAVDGEGQIVPQTIRNEETGQTDTVEKWAVRVAREVLERIRADKRDDGIIQARAVGRKKRGYLEPDWTIPVTGGAITKW